ncbi:hypothetical protein ACUH97_02450 [Dermabacteraceae bacterium P13088]
MPDSTTLEPAENAAQKPSETPPPNQLLRGLGTEISFFIFFTLVTATLAMSLALATGLWQAASQVDFNIKEVILNSNAVFEKTLDVLIYWLSCLKNLVEEWRSGSSSTSITVATGFLITYAFYSLKEANRFYSDKQAPHFISPLLVVYIMCGLNLYATFPLFSENNPETPNTLANLIIVFIHLSLGAFICYPALRSSESIKTEREARITECEECRKQLLERSSSSSIIWRSFAIVFAAALCCFAYDAWKPRLTIIAIILLMIAIDACFIIDPNQDKIVKISFWIPSFATSLLLLLTTIKMWAEIAFLEASMMQNAIKFAAGASSLFLFASLNLAAFSKAKWAENNKLFKVIRVCSTRPVSERLFCLKLRFKIWHHERKVKGLEKHIESYSRK